MADEKKYTAQEAAIAVLKKAEEVLSKSSLIKATSHAYLGNRDTQTGHEKGVNTKAYLAPAKHGKEVSHAGEWVRDKHAGAAKAIAHKKLGELRDMPKPNLPKSEDASENEIGTKFQKSSAATNPDKDQDAELGEKVEHLCEEHMLANKNAERKEGHKIFQKSECAKCNAMKKSEEFVFKSEKMAEGFSGLHKVEYHKVDFAEPMKKAESMAGDKKAPSNPMKPEVAPNQPQAGESEHPGKRILEQKALRYNPKEQAEGNNPPAGAAQMALKLEKKALINFKTSLDIFLAKTQ